MSTMDRGRFSNHFRLSVDKMCFPSSVCKRFLKKCWRAQFHLKMAKVLTRFFCSFIISISTIDRGRFSSHFLLSVDKMCFPSSGCESFLKKGLRAQFYLKMADFFGDLYFQFQRPQWTVVDFPTTSSYPGIKCVFPFSVCESFPKKCWRGQFYLKMTKALARFFWWFILSISTPTMDRGRFSSHFLLSVDKMSFPFFSLWEFFEKMLMSTILFQNCEGPDPIFLVIYPQ